MASDVVNLGRDDALGTIATPPPALPDAVLHAVLLEHYGISGELQPLVSERDQNCVVTTSDGERFVLKIANRAEDPLVTDFQIRALLHLAASNCVVPTPRVVPTRDGAVSIRVALNDESYVGRVVSFLNGRPVTGETIDADTAFALGAGLARLDQALADFEHPGDSQPLLWDMQRALELRPLLVHVADAELRDAIGACLDEFESSALPYIQSAPRQVIHGDLNPGNVLLDSGTLAGIIDFGDMVRAPVIVDMAIAASYLRAIGEDPLVLITAAVAGFASVTAIDISALPLLHCMIRTRLATSITLLQWRLQERGEADAYSAQSLTTEDDSIGFFRTMSSIGAREFQSRLREAIGN